MATLNLPSVDDVPQEHPLSGLTKAEPTPSVQAHNKQVVEKKSSSVKKQYHIVFSTSCDAQQHWESYVLFYHAWKVGQPGNVTRLLSGCGDDDKEKQQIFYENYIQTLSPNFHVHFTPDFSQVQHHVDNDKTRKYKYMNKPFSLKHWLENELGYGENNLNTKYDDDIVFLVDPDMILLKPLTHDFRNDPTVQLIDKPDAEHKVVRRGHPMAQQDGYLSNTWMALDMEKITLDKNSPVLAIKQKDGFTHWNAGPPYIFTALDGYKIATKWVDFAPRVVLQFPNLFAEMFGYIIASAHLELPHTLIKSLVVSTTETLNREAWSFVDNLPEVCPHPPPSGIFALHYCKRYILGKRWFWSKYRLRKDYMDCHVPLMQEPDPSIQEEREWYGPPPVQSYKGIWTHDHGNFTAKRVKREAFMLCGMIPKVNEAVEYYKRQACGDSGNYSKVYNVHDDPG